MATPTERDLTAELVEAVRAAEGSGSPVRITGGNTKHFYGRRVQGTDLSLAGHTGIVTYDPAELVLTARAGTRLADIETLLQAHGQRLPFEPPAFGPQATIGGTVAAGLAGPARAARGPVRDYVLGTRLLASGGRVLRFGGEVMKNVAGYDVSRLLAGSLGILGVILEVSLKVLPTAAATRTLCQSMDANAAIGHLATATRSGVPVTGSFWCAGVLYVRLEGSETALDAGTRAIGGDPLAGPEAARIWSDIREQSHAFFVPERNLWRVTASLRTPMPAATSRHVAFEWNGLQRWAVGDDALQSLTQPDSLRDQGTLFRAADGASAPDREVFPPLPGPLMRLHQAVKASFDPHGVFNPGRMYRTL